MTTDMIATPFIIENVESCLFVICVILKFRSICLMVKRAPNLQ